MNLKNYIINDFETTPWIAKIFDKDVELAKNIVSVKPIPISEYKPDFSDIYQVSTFSNKKFLNRIVIDNNIKLNCEYDIIYYDIETTAENRLFPDYDNVTALLLCI